MFLYKKSILWRLGEPPCCKLAFTIAYFIDILDSSNARNSNSKTEYTGIQRTYIAEAEATEEIIRKNNKSVKAIKDFAEKMFPKSRVKLNKSSDQMVLGRHKGDRNVTRRYCFRYDMATWTMRVRRPNCGRPSKKTIARLKVKRIIYLNGSIDYPICNKTTRKCKEQPYFSRKLNKMIERPPCCIAHVLELFAHVTSALDDIGVRYYLTAGGLVGWVKSKAMPRYENDLDIHVDWRRWNTKKLKAALVNLKEKYGHWTRFYPKVPNFRRVYYSEKNRVFIDMWPYKIEKRNGSKWVRVLSTLTWYPNLYNTTFPLKRTVFSGLKTWVPNDPEAVLDIHYQDRFQWRQKVLCKIKSKNKCIA